jgi:hypothetical protein
MIRDDDSWYFIVEFFHGIPSRKSLEWNIYIYIQVEGIPLYPYISRISHSWIIMEYLGKIQVKSNQKWAEQSAFEIVTDDFPSDQKTLHFGRGFPSHET